MTTEVNIDISVNEHNAANSSDISRNTSRTYIFPNFLIQKKVPKGRSLQQITNKLMILPS